MRIAAIYDIHGNLPALEAVLDEIEGLGVDRVVVGGDVFPGPLALECLELLRGLEVRVDFLRGNGERVVLAARRGEAINEVPEPHRPPIRWCAEQLDDRISRWLAGWPPGVSVEVGELGPVCFCHATPGSDVEIVTRATPELELQAAFENVPSTLVVCGHTHIQFDRAVGDRRIVNAGSVGMPFDAPGAYWLLLGPDVELRRTEYDLEEAAARVRRSGSPDADRFAASSILEPPSAAEMTELFESSRKAS